MTQLSLINPDELPVCSHHIAPILQMRMLESSEVKSKDRVHFALDTHDTLLPPPQILELMDLRDR